MVILFSLYVFIAILTMGIIYNTIERSAWNGYDPISETFFMGLIWPLYWTLKLGQLIGYIFRGEWIK